MVCLLFFKAYLTPPNKALRHISITVFNKHHASC